VVLLDSETPNLDAYAMCERLRAQPGGKDIAIYALTSVEHVDLERAEGAGLDGYLVKPLDATALERLLEAPRRPATSEPQRN
jgi:CheY-like chemotaxis protein